MIDLKNLHRRYCELLLDDVVPFWFRHGIYRTHGGVLPCMNDDGALVSGDKFLLLERMQADQAGNLSMESAHGTGRQK